MREIGVENQPANGYSGEVDSEPGRSLRQDDDAVAQGGLRERRAESGQRPENGRDRRRAQPGEAAGEKRRGSVEKEAALRQPRPRSHPEAGREAGRGEGQRDPPGLGGELRRGEESERRDQSGTPPAGCREPRRERRGDGRNDAEQSDRREREAVQEEQVAVQHERHRQGERGAVAQAERRSPTRRGGRR